MKLRFGLLAYSFFIISILKAQEKGTGLIFADPEEYRKIPLATSPMMGILPPSKDLSTWFPTPGNQGAQSSCVGWAVAYGLKSYQEAVERNRRPSDGNKTYSPAFIYNQIKISNCGGGSSIQSALGLLRSSGVSSLFSFPYDANNCSNTPGETVRQSAKAYAIADWRIVDIQNEVEVKNQLINGFPIVIGMYVDEGFQRLGFNEIYGGRTGNELGGHAMVIVGYDNSRQAYKVFNSWGINWGTNGFGWISYSAFKDRVKEAYTVQDIVIVKPDNITPPHLPDISDNIPEPLPNTLMSGSIGQPDVLHNQLVPSAKGPVLGMIVSVRASLFNVKGAIGQVIIRFYLPNGSPLYANTSELVYRDAHGLVAAGTTPTTILHENEDFPSIQISIPYYSLNFPNNNGRVQYNVATIATLYINKFEKARSTFTPMSIWY